MNHPFVEQDPVDRVSISRLGVIINPKSGSKQGVSLVPDVLQPVWGDQYGIEIEVFETEYARHAIQLAKTIDLDSLDGLVICGGDGSFHELVNGMMQRDDNKSIPLGLIPSGTGNAVGHTLSLHKKRLEEAAHRIARGEVFPLDLNRVKFKTSKSSRSAIKYSVMTICWGLVGDIGTAAELNRNNVLAKYGVAAWVGFKSKPEKVTIQLEGGDLDQPLVINKDLMTAFIQNTPHFGEGYYVTPAAKIDDGQMDVCVVERAHRGTLLKMFTQLPKGSHIHSDIAQTYSVEKAVITPALSPGLINIDGEVIPFAGPITVTVVPRALSVFSSVSSHLKTSDLPEPVDVTVPSKSGKDKGKGKKGKKGKGKGKGKGKK